HMTMQSQIRGIRFIPYALQLLQKPSTMLFDMRPQFILTPDPMHGTSSEPSISQPSKS
ncbi:hypothetical protein COCVIDRAFT_109832, partial [Bipolaris victoriae FI3]